MSNADIVLLEMRCATRAALTSFEIRPLDPHENLAGVGPFPRSSQNTPATKDKECCCLEEASKVQNPKFRISRRQEYDCNSILKVTTKLVFFEQIRSY